MAYGCIAQALLKFVGGHYRGGLDAPMSLSGLSLIDYIPSIVSSHSPIKNRYHLEKGDFPDDDRMEEISDFYQQCEQGFGSVGNQLVA